MLTSSNYAVAAVALGARTLSCRPPSFLGPQASAESWEGTLDWEVVAEHWSLQEEAEQGAAQNIPTSISLLQQSCFRDTGFGVGLLKEALPCILLRTSDGHK